MKISYKLFSLIFNILIYYNKNNKYLYHYIRIFNIMSNNIELKLKLIKIYLNGINNYIFKLFNYILYYI